MHGVAERAVHAREREGDDGEEAEHDRAAPREPDQHGEQAARVERPAPGEVAPEVLPTTDERKDEM